MMLFTSNYARHAKDPNAVSISLGGGPWWYKGAKYPDLAPSPELLREYKSGKIDEKGYTVWYLRLLTERNLDPYKVVNDMSDGRIMLCYESPNAFCHRHIVAYWITKHTGIPVHEHFLYTKGKKQTNVDAFLSF